MNVSRSDSRNSSFNLDRFYQDLQRVESSLGKGETRKTAQTPILKNDPSTAPE
jgi:hypothetical protein